MIDPGEVRFRQLANALPQIVFTTTPDGRLDFINTQWEVVTGTPVAEALGTGFMSFIHPDDVARVRETVAEPLARGAPMTLEYRLRSHDGSYRWRTVRVGRLYDDAGMVTAWCGTSTDIDDLRRDTARLRQQAALLEQTMEGIVVRDLEHRVSFWNRGAERLYGYTFAEVQGRSVLEFLYRDTRAARTATATLLATGQWQGMLTAWDKRGEAHQIEAHWTVVRDETGVATSVIAIHLDVTDRVRLEEQLQQAMRLEAVGQLSGGMAHDFNNLLTVILGNSELLVSRLGNEPRLQQLAEMTRSAAQRGAALTQRMLAFARRQVLDPRAVDVGALLREHRPTLQGTLREDIALSFEVADECWHAEVDPVQLEHALVNLCANARDALPTGGTVRVSVANVRVTEEAALLARDVAAGSFVRIDVTDSGIGIAPEIIARVFDPFFTTKDQGKGTGLGLSMVYGFAKQSAGHVRIASEPGKGTTVSLFLPRAEGASVEPRKVAAASTLVRGTETILVTEDDELVRSYVCEQLAALGYQVHAAAEASAALRILESGQPIDLLFTDIVMPGQMNGRDLAEAAQRLRPGLAVLFTSGYPEDVISQGGRLDVGIQLLGKPYSRTQLANKLRAALAPLDPHARGTL